MVSHWLSFRPSVIPPSIHIFMSGQISKFQCKSKYNDKVNFNGLGGSFGCAVRLETRRSRVQPPPRLATFFRGD